MTTATLLNKEQTEALWVSLTLNERAVFITFPDSGHLFDSYSADEYNDFCGFWVCVDKIAKYTGLTMDQVKGVLSSLVKKGLIRVNKDSEEVNWASFTANGYSLLRIAVPAYEMMASDLVTGLIAFYAKDGNLAKVERTMDVVRQLTA